MDMLTLLLGLMLVACGLMGWLIFIYLGRQKQRRNAQADKGLEAPDSAKKSDESKADQASST